MACVKTAISIEESLFKEADRLAGEMSMSRSKLVCLALRDYVDKQKAAELTRRINDSLPDGPDDEDRAFAKLADASFAKFAEDDEW